MEDYCSCDVLARLEVREHERVLAWNCRIEEDDSLGRVLPLEQHFALRIIHDAGDFLPLAHAENVVNTLDGGWFLVTDLFIEYFNCVLLNDDVQYVVWLEVVHVVRPKLMELIICKLAVLLNCYILLDVVVV